MMKYLQTYEQHGEKQYKMIDIDYKAVVKNHKGTPIYYITDLSLVKDNGQEVEIKSKGYRLLNKNINGEQKRVWYPVDDFEKNRTTTIYKTDFQDGTVRKKVYNTEYIINENYKYIKDNLEDGDKVLLHMFVTEQRPKEFVDAVNNKGWFTFKKHEFDTDTFFRVYETVNWDRHKKYNFYANYTDIIDVIKKNDISIELGLI